MQEEQTCGKDYLQFRLGGSNRSASVCCCQRNGSSSTRCSLELEAPERLEIISAVRRLLFLSASQGPSGCFWPAGDPFSRWNSAGWSRYLSPVSRASFCTNTQDVSSADILSRLTCIRVLCLAVPQEALMDSYWPGSVDKPFPAFPLWCSPQSSGSSSRLMARRETSASKPSTCSQVSALTEFLSFRVKPGVFYIVFY